MKRCALLLCAGLLAGACNRGGIGAPCTRDQDCASGLGCAGGPFPGGYCTADCSTKDCPSGVCTPVPGGDVCLQSCEAARDCRPGYQCWNDLCTVPCATDTDCGTGAACASGTCMPLPGSSVGSPCSADTDCSSRVCLGGACAKGCARERDCPDGETCALNPGASAIQPACVARRRTGGPGASCTSDADCDRGSCQLGMCVELCLTTPDCGRGMSCAGMVAPLAGGSAPAFEGCLPTSGTFEMSADDLAVVPVPSTAQSFTLYTRLQTFDFNDVVGVTSLIDPAGRTLYSTPKTDDDYYALPVRYQPAESDSTMLVPSSPQVTLTTGPYPFTVAAQTPGAATSTRVFFKLAPQPIASGTIDLNFYLTDLSSNCTGTPITLANAPTVLADEVSTIEKIYSQVNVTIDKVTWHDANGAMNTVEVQEDPSQPMFPDLDDVLEQATAGQPTTVGMDVVLLRSITTNGSTAGLVLGVAGGIPGSPVLGSPHSGAVVSIQAACGVGVGGSVEVLAATIAHEVGHTLGLFHTVEQDGHTDPIPDDDPDGKANLMYWLESNVTTVHLLSPEQGQVIRDNPKVR